MDVKKSQTVFIVLVTEGPSFSQTSTLGNSRSPRAFKSGKILRSSHYNTPLLSASLSGAILLLLLLFINFYNPDMVWFVSMRGVLVNSSIGLALAVFLLQIKNNNNKSLNF